ncbi:MAG: hypothetical protein M3083_21945 [Actinomycetota bacterium]|nr:hypothetical protein [Actinomycetota bacterium]
MAHSASTIGDAHLTPSGRGAYRAGRAGRPTARTHGPEADGSRRLGRAVTARALSATSAALILAGGYAHLCLYRHGYRFIPKIGVSFLLQAGSSAVLGALLLRGGRRRVRRRTVALAQLIRLAAMTLSLGTLGALGIAHTHGGLFQFHELGLRPAPQTLVAIVAESLAVLLLGFAMLEGRTAPRNDRETRSHHQAARPAIEMS